MKKSEFWRSCNFCGASNIENWESHVKECPEIPQKEKEVLLEMGRSINEMSFDDFPEEVKKS